MDQDGRIAQNEPGSSLTSRTRVKTLAHQTIMSNLHLFSNDLDAAPKLVLTVGLGTFMDAREIVLLITGAAARSPTGARCQAKEADQARASAITCTPRLPGVSKAMALSKIVEEGMNHLWPASVAQTHPRATVVCDEDATQEMRVKTVRYFKGIQEVHGRVMQHT